jgi:hypothetical protein
MGTRGEGGDIQVSALRWIFDKKIINEEKKLLLNLLLYLLYIITHMCDYRRGLD